MIKSNIVIFCYNRPRHLKKLFNSLDKIKDRKFYIISDGPKNNNDNYFINQVRNQIKVSNLNFKKKKLFNKNIGVRKIFGLGLKWIFKFEKQIIILEDDIIPSQSFFRFCDKMLFKYKNKKKISQITGCNINDRLTRKLNHSYFFSKYSNIWGWATWKDRWKDYDNNFNKLNFLINSKNFERSCLNTNEFKHWKKYFYIHKKDRKIGTWDYAWTYTNFLKQRLSIVPKMNLIKNIGYDNATGKNPNKLKKLKAKSINEKIKHPKIIKQNLTYDLYSSINIYSIPKTLIRIKKKFELLIKKII